MNPSSPIDASVNSQKWPMVFLHRFKCGLIAKATLTERGDYCVEWSKTPTSKIVPEYMRWRKEIFDAFSKATGIEVLVVTLL